MIGPHTGIELELMLAGRKKLSVFHDEVINGQVISEEIIPEQKFRPYIENGTFSRFCEDIRTKKSNSLLRFVCFTTKDEEWRAKTFFWIANLTLSQTIPSNGAFEIIIGRLLGYSETDIADYLVHSKAMDALAFAKAS